MCQQCVFILCVVSCFITRERERENSGSVVQLYRKTDYKPIIYNCTLELLSCLLFTNKWYLLRIVFPFLIYDFF